MEEGIKRAAELLAKGAKMLAYYCPECKMPLFEYRDKIICPACEREVIVEKIDRKVVIKFAEDERIKIDISERKDEIKSILANVVIKLLRRIEESDNINEIEKIADILQKLANFAEKWFSKSTLAS